MNTELLMHVDSLQEIMERLKGGCALLQAIYDSAVVATISKDALGGMCDLLESICRDFQADIECAEHCAEKGVAV